uniref:stigma-specific STIG1-like protein 1 n=1 Tax=Fragaria vesca subsp. vesca TaxID=101020 RepID=UPI0005C85752|nr:PREDICTED: stigma-specific STIG1-like protein 1 [Fragaria vesca subsp. vesca]
MKGSIQVLFLLAMLMALAAITLSASAPEEDREEWFSDEDNDLPATLSQMKTSLRGASRFLATRATTTTCDKNPKVCKAAGSVGRDCCKKKCVDLKTDRVNCGKCGKKCKYSEICCKGKCLKSMSDKKNCGSCNNKCKKGSSCVYGMCSYA